MKPTEPISDWSAVFRFLKYTIDDEVMKRNHKDKVIIFLDEIPWIDPNAKDGFLSALGYFWNTYCEERGNVVFLGVLLCCSTQEFDTNLRAKKIPSSLKNS